MKPPVPRGRMRSRISLSRAPLALVLDAPRYADVIHRRHVDEEAAGQRDVARDARAFAGDRVFRDLDDDLLSFAQQIGDRRSRGGGPDYVVDLKIVGRLALVLLEVFEHVGDVEERVALEAEVDERRLHPGQDLRHAPFVDVADDRPMPRALDPELDDLTLVEHGDARLVFGRVDHDLARHGGGIVDCASWRSTIYFSGSISGGRGDVGTIARSLRRWRTTAIACSPARWPLRMSALTANGSNRGRSSSATCSGSRMPMSGSWSRKCRGRRSASATRSATARYRCQIPVICLYRPAFTRRCTAMVAGDRGIQLIEYADETVSARGKLLVASNKRHTGLSRAGIQCQPRPVTTLRRLFGASFPA